MLIVQILDMTPKMSNPPIARSFVIQNLIFVVSFISRKICWAVHVARMKKTEDAYRIVGLKCRVRHHLATNTYGGGIYVKYSLKEQGTKMLNWLEVAQYNF
jgi:hypothetical protein